MATPEQMEQLLQGPAHAPPADVRPNFVNPPDEYEIWVVTTVLCVVVSTIAVAMRLFTKLRLVREFGAEDYTCILGFLMWIAYIVPTARIMLLGGGIHQWNVQLKDFMSILYYANIAAILYGITVFIIKLSILFQYKKIFCPNGAKTWMWWGVWITIAVNLVYYVAITFIEIFICNHREKYWNIFITEGHCMSANGANISAGAVNSVSDFVILLLPQGVIWKLQMPTKRKIAVSAIFLTGFFVCITSVLRLYYAIRLAQTGDVTYNLALMGFWTYAEISVGVVCCCLPMSARFFNHVGEKLSTIRSTISFNRLLSSHRPSSARSSGPSSSSSSPRKGSDHSDEDDIEMAMAR